MKISIIYHIYKNYTHLNASLQSIINQTDSDFEFILINDCAIMKVKNIISNTNFSAIKKFTYYEFNQNLGHALSYNTCIKNIKTDYVYYCGSNIILDKDFISTIKSIKLKYPKIDVLLFGKHKMLKETITTYKTITGPLNYCVTNSTRSMVISSNYLQKNDITYNVSAYYFLVYIYRCLSNTENIVYVNSDLATFKKNLNYTYNFYDVFEQNNYLIETYSKTQFYISHRQFIEAMMIASVMKNFLYRMFQTYTMQDVRSSACSNAIKWLKTHIPNWQTNKYFISPNYFLYPISKEFTKVMFKPFFMKLFFKKYEL